MAKVTITIEDYTEKGTIKISAKSAPPIPPNDVELTLAQKVAQKVVSSLMTACDLVDIQKNGKSILEKENN